MNGLTLGLITVVASLVLVLALNWNSFQRMGWGNVIRQLLIWGAIIAGLVLVLRLLGF